MFCRNLNWNSITRVLLVYLENRGYALDHWGSLLVLLDARNEGFFPASSVSCMLIFVSRACLVVYIPCAEEWVTPPTPGQPIYHMVWFIKIQTYLPFETKILGTPQFSFHG